MPHKLYHVRPGDTLTGIARWAKVAYPDLLAINPQIRNPNLIRAGETILLPDGVSRSDVLGRAAEEVFPDAAEPKWPKLARRELGVSEVKDGDNPRILEYLATTTLDQASKQSDETSWCAAFVNWCVETAGKKGNDSAWALDWARYGKAANPPAPGSIVVLSRQSASESGGHVGFFLRDLGETIEMLGGNQGDAVSIDAYPKAGKKGGYVYAFKAYRNP